MHESVARCAAVPARPGDVSSSTTPIPAARTSRYTLIGAIEVDGRVGGYSAGAGAPLGCRRRAGREHACGARRDFAEGVIVPPLRLTPTWEHFSRQRPDARTRPAISRPTRAVTRGRGLRALLGALRLDGVRGAATDLLDYAERRAGMPSGGVTRRPHRHGLARRRCVDEWTWRSRCASTSRTASSTSNFTGTAQAARAM